MSAAMVFLTQLTLSPKKYATTAKNIVRKVRRNTQAVKNPWLRSKAPLHGSALKKYIQKGCLFLSLEMK